MKLQDIPKDSALLVKPTGLSKVMVGDNILMAINGVIDIDGNFIPYNESLQVLKKELNSAAGDQVVFIKQDKTGL